MGTDQPDSAADADAASVRYALAIGGIVLPGADVAFLVTQRPVLNRLCARIAEGLLPDDPA